MLLSNLSTISNINTIGSFLFDLNKRITDLSPKSLPPFNFRTWGSYHIYSVNDVVRAHWAIFLQKNKIEIIQKNVEKSCLSRDLNPQLPDYTLCCTLSQVKMVWQSEKSSRFVCPLVNQFKICWTL